MRAVTNAILYAAEHPERKIYFGDAGKFLELSQRFAPRLVHLVLNRISYQGQRTDKPKSDQVPHNLFEHLEGHNQEHGSFSQETKLIRVFTGLSIRPKLRCGFLGLLAGITGLGFIDRRLSSNEILFII